MSDMPAVTVKGGPGSGNFGHAGRQGKHGGSAPKSGEGAMMSIRSGATAERRQQMAADLSMRSIRQARNTTKAEMDQQSEGWRQQARDSKAIVRQIEKVKKSNPEEYAAKGMESQFNKAMTEYITAHSNLREIKKYRKFASDKPLERKTAKQIGEELESAKARRDEIQGSEEYKQIKAIGQYKIGAVKNGEVSMLKSDAAKAGLYSPKEGEKLDDPVKVKVSPKLFSIAQEDSDLSARIDDLRDADKRAKEVISIEHGKRMASKYDGRSALTGKRFDAGEEIYYRDGSAVPVSEVQERKAAGFTVGSKFNTEAPAPRPIADRKVIRTLTGTDHGGKVWEMGGKRRIYFDGDTVLDRVGLKTRYTRSGKLESATLNGQKIDNQQARDMATAVAGGKFWYDLADGKFYHKTDSGLIPAPWTEFVAKASKTLKQTKKEAEGGLSVFKDKTGRYRWISISSNAFQDHDLEIVSTKALEEDVDRADKDGEYGPLRWWHMGDHSSGVDIGDCDFNMMSGRMLIESGTFRDERVGEAIKESKRDYQVSIGFDHPRSEPVNGVFYHIKRFERSLLPAGRASNGLTSFSVKGVDDMATKAEKEKALAELIGEDLAKQKLNEAAVSEKSAIDSGTAFKEAETETTKGKMPAAVLEALQKKNEAEDAEEGDETPVDEEEGEKPVKGKKVSTKVEAKKEDDDAELDALLAELEEDEEEEEGDTAKETRLPELLGDIPTRDFAGMLSGAIAAAFQPFFETQKEIVSSIKELKEMGGMTTKEAGAMNEKVARLEEAASTQAKALIETRKKLKEVIGDMPKAAKGYVASQADDTVTTKEAAGPASDPFATFAQEFVFKGVAQ